MKQGTTTTFKVKQFDLPDITEIIFSFTNDKNNVVVERTTPTTDDGQIHKSYPTEVSLEDGYYKIGLDQEETLKLNETFYVEAQIMFSGAVTKAYIDKVKMPHTFYTKVIDGATTNGEEIELTMELSDVIEINGSGSSNYNDLTNKPRINNIELIGNKTDTDLGLATKTELNAKQNVITGGNGIDVTSDVVSVDNGNHLYFSNGKLTVGTSSLGISDLRSELADTSYATPYKPLATREYVDNLMSGAIKRLVVESLPTQDIDTNTIYMVLKSVPSTNNIYDEYMYINNAWELIGSTEVDLSNYYTKTETNTITQALANNVSLSIDDNTYFVTVALKHDNTVLATYTADLYISDLFQNIVNCFDALNNKQDLLTFSNGLELDETDNATLSVSLDEINGYLEFNNNGELKVDIERISHFAPFRSELTNGLYANPLQPKLTAGTNITIDANNVISASGGSYTFTNGLAESSGTVGIDLASGSKLLIDANDKLDVDLSSKQDTIDTTNKLSADLVDDTSATNKFVTSSDITAWNGKQDEIDSSHKLSSDLVDDTNNTNLFVTSSEKSTWNGKADNTTITTDTTSTTVSLTLADNHEYRYTQDLTSLTLTMPNGDFISSIVFASGSTPTSMTYDSSIKWSGDDVTNGQFVPSADKDYDIMMYYNGLNVNGIVRGV